MKLDYYGLKVRFWPVYKSFGTYKGFLLGILNAQRSSKFQYHTSTAVGVGLSRLWSDSGSMDT